MIWLLLLAQVAAPAPPVVVQVPPPPVVAAPADPARLAAAARLVELVNLDATLDRTFVALAPVFAQAVIGIVTEDAGTRQVIAAIDAKPDGRRRFVAILSQEYMRAIRSQYPALKQGAAAEYAALFTLDELEAITAFYGTAAGAKLLRLMPDLQERLAKRGNMLGQGAGEVAGRRAMERATHEILGVTAPRT